MPEVRKTAAFAAALPQPFTRDRLASIVLGKPSDLATRTKVNYYDRDSLRQAGFHEDAREQMMEETQGRGAMSLADATPDDIDFYTGADLEQ